MLEEIYVNYEHNTSTALRGLHGQKGEVRIKEARYARGTEL